MDKVYVVTGFDMQEADLKNVELLQTLPNYYRVFESKDRAFEYFKQTVKEICKKHKSDLSFDYNRLDDVFNGKTLAVDFSDSINAGKMKFKQLKDGSFIWSIYELDDIAFYFAPAVYLHEFKVL